MQSSFIAPGSASTEGKLALLHLSRDSTLPVILSTAFLNAQDDGYAEGVVTNTKFGSFPHSTLINVPWGSQVRASKVDTGSRGRREYNATKKRKAEAISTDSPITDASSPSLKQATAASSGFIHVLPPTPESWTISLPHRTQVVYTPDYSYILHRIRARPGSVVLEAGSGSGSFTHAAARAVFSGGNSEASSNTATETVKPFSKPQGKVYTFEFHPERHEKVQVEMRQHDLSAIVEAAHRDVYREGFLCKTHDGSVRSPGGNAVFLDLPAPWEALPHLTRSSNNDQPSALDPRNLVHICTFSPCIEQAQKTISALRRFNWLEIEMVEMQHKRIDVRREFTGLQYDGMRSVNSVAADVDEALMRLRESEERIRSQQGSNTQPARKQKGVDGDGKQVDAAKVLYQGGRVVHRSEPEIKTHTSYLVFAVLPREWTDEDEKDAQRTLQHSIGSAPKTPKSQRQMKKEAKIRKKFAQEGSSHINGQDIGDGDA